MGPVWRYGIPFLKWDLNRYISEPGSRSGREIWLRHVAGVYTVIDRFGRKYPELDVKSCFGGGGRVDLRILSRTDQVWVSVNTDTFGRHTIQDGALYRLQRQSNLKF